MYLNLMCTLHIDDNDEQEVADMIDPFSIDRKNKFNSLQGTWFYPVTKKTH